MWVNGLDSEARDLCRYDGFWTRFARRFWSLSLGLDRWGVCLVLFYGVMAWDWGLGGLRRVIRRGCSDEGCGR